MNTKLNDFIRKVIVKMCITHQYTKNRLKQLVAGMKLLGAVVASVSFKGIVHPKMTIVIIYSHSSCSEPL